MPSNTTLISLRMPRPSRDRPPSAKVTTLSMILLGALAAVTIWGEFTADTSTNLIVLDIGLGLLGCALIPVVLIRPVHGAIVLAVLAAFAPSVTPLATMATLTVAQRRRLPIAAAVAGAGIVAHLVRNVWRPADGISYSWWAVLIVIAHVALTSVGAPVARAA